MKQETVVGGTVVAFIGAVAMSMWGCPQYMVYSQRMDGEAQLAHAHASRQVQIQDAQSKLEAAKSLAQAEVERAKGIAEANRIVGDSLKNNEAYLRYLYIDGLKDKDNLTTIYVPTEAGLPILEAGRSAK
jgi:regulator of protease activity HflC (stomatin/prohibitin superfamily)